MYALTKKSYRLGIFRCITDASLTVTKVFHVILFFLRVSRVDYSKTTRPTLA